uniref:Uncharacterized protein n=1 Tax=Octopus bimaculoides TaxID=37653 RepID=A0A0L8HSW6_OCTBM
MTIKLNVYVTDVSVFERTKNSSIEATILRWAGHVAGMTETRLPRQVFIDRLSTKRNLRGHPLCRYND